MATEIREALEKAFEIEEKEEVPTPQELMEAPADESTSEPVSEEKTAEPTEEKSEPVAEKTDSTSEKPETVAEKAPASWSPKARQAWATLPSEIRAEVAKRERDFAVGIQRNSEAAKFGDSVQKVLAPFQAVMRMEGADEIQAVAGLAQTAATLRLGTQTQKAELLRDIINAYGVDISILDSVLAGEKVDEEENKIARLIDERLKPVQSLIQTIEQGRLQHASTVVFKVDQEIQEFEKNAEFINDVRDDMADLLEISAKRGKQMTLQEAYDKAIAMRSDIQEIIQQRNRTHTLKQGHQRVQEKRQAAASLPGGTGGAPATKQPSSIREALEQAFNAAGGAE